MVASLTLKEKYFPQVSKHSYMDHDFILWLLDDCHCNNKWSFW